MATIHDGSCVYENVFRSGYDNYTIQREGDSLLVQAMGLGACQQYVVDSKFSNFDGFRVYGFAEGNSWVEKEEKIMALGFWDSFKLVNPHVGELYETENEFRDAVIAAGNMVYAETALNELEHAFHPVIVDARASVHPVFTSRENEATAPQESRED